MPTYAQMAPHLLKLVTCERRLGEALEPCIVVLVESPGLALELVRGKILGNMGCMGHYSHMRYMGHTGHKGHTGCLGIAVHGCSRWLSSP